MERVRSELLRKLVHIGVGGFAFLLRWLMPWQAAALALVAMLFNLFLLHRVTGAALLRVGERERGFSWGIVLYPAAVLSLVIVFRSRLELAAGSWALLAFGDGMATVVGLLLGGPRLPWNPMKTWAGFAAFVLYGTAMSAVLIRWTQQAVLDAAQAGNPRGVSWIGGSFLDDRVGGAVLADPLLLIAGCFAASLIAAMAESLKTGLDDNLLVALAGGTALFAATLVEPGRLADSGAWLLTHLLWGAAINALVAAAAYLAGAVGASGVVCGWLLGTTLYTFAGWRGFLMLLLFFLLGTASTRLGFARKTALGIAQGDGGRRGARHAIANTITGVLFAFLAVATPHRELCWLGLVAAFATAAFDTVSSEIGQAFGRAHYLVTTLRRVPPGTNGAISVEGTLGGLAGAVILAAAALAVNWVTVPGALVVVAAAFVGGTLESYLGATVERRKWLDNELVNFANTVAGSVTACVVYRLWLV